MAKYLDYQGVSTLWNKTKEQVNALKTSDNTFTGSNTFNGTNNFTGLLKYNTLQATIPSGYNHAIRQYAYEDYLDFTDNNADNSYNRTVMRMNGKTGIVEFPLGLIVKNNEIQYLTRHGHNVSLSDINSIIEKLKAGTADSLDVYGDVFFRLGSTEYNTVQAHIEYWNNSFHLTGVAFSNTYAPRLINNNDYNCSCTSQGENVSINYLLKV